MKYRLLLAASLCFKVAVANNIFIETVDGKNGVIAGTVPTLHIFHDNVFILYGDETHHMLKLIEKENGNFNTIHTINGTSNASNFDIDKNGNIHICYLKDQGIYYDTNKSGKWNSTYVDDAYASTWTRIGCRVDSHGAVHMSYDYNDISNNTYQLHYATNKSGEFEIETILDKNTQYSDLAIGKDDKPYISFSDFRSVYLTYKDGGKWIQPKYVGGWTDNSLVYDARDDEELIAFINSGRLYFAKTTDNNEVSSYPVDTSCIAQLPSIAIGKKGVGIAYLCSKDDKTYAKIAIIDGDIQEIDDVTPTENYWHGEYGISLDFDSKGQWHIAYYDIKNKDLKYATEALVNNENVDDEKNATKDDNVTNYSTINVKKGWQNIGAKEDINVNVFDNSCVDFIWKYDTSDTNNPTWKLYIANKNTYALPSNIGILQFIKSGEGYWIRGNDNCEIKIKNTSSNTRFMSKLIDEEDLFGKKLELIHRDSNWNMDYWIEFLFNNNHTFSGTYNDAITNKYATTSEIRKSGHAISGTWKIVDSKIYINTDNDKTIILTPVELEIEDPIGFEVFESNKYEKNILTIQNYYSTSN